ncbi:uncharacterized protein [Malus domestica]|uniref:uncharacterized protein n=1 Tax=Malus domestica TaxID=3750 RepID=UPI003974A284
MGKRETPLLIAATNGVTEMRTGNSMCTSSCYTKKTPIRDKVFSEVDNAGNSVLHLAATAMLEANNPCINLGPVLQMQREIKWFEFVKTSMPPHFFAPYNKKNQTARAIFSESHTELVKTGGAWLTKTSEN